MNVRYGIVMLGMLVAVGPFCGVTAMADFPGDFKSAMGLHATRHNQEAQDAFARLAAAAPTCRSKATCQAYAALSLSRQNQYEPAIELARQIEFRPASIECQMQIMLEHRRWKTLVEAFQGEDIAAWPDYCIHKGFHHRGTAYRLTGNAQAAAKDLRGAVENSVTADQFQVIAWDELGGVYQTLKDEEKAIEAYRKVQEFPAYRGFYPYADATLGIVGVLLRQGKPNDALVDLRKLDLDRSSGNWRFLILQAYGDVSLAQGKEKEALEFYGQAVNVKDAARGYVDRLKKTISTLDRIPSKPESK